MRKAVAACFLVVLCASVARPAHAQQGVPSEVGVREAARLSIRPELRQRIADEDTVSSSRTRRVENGRVDVKTGAYRARYRIRERVANGLPPESAAREHLRRSAEAYGMLEGVDDLTVKSVRGGKHAHHIRLQQTVDGVPVYRSSVTVSLDKTGQPTMVINGYASHLDHVASFDSTPRVSSTQAARIVQTASSRGLLTADPELVVYPSKPPLLAWKVDAVSRDLPVSWEVLVDARTGEIIQLLDVTLHARAMVDSPSALERSPTPRHTDMLSAPARSRDMAIRQVDGTGLVFDPDPLTTAGVSYGGQYQDFDDGDTQALNEQRFAVTLRDISEGNDGLYRLEGPYVHIVGDPSSVPAESSPDAFTYTRGDDLFEAVNAYYHIDKSQRYVQSLGFTDSELFPIKNEPVNVNPRAFERDDSNFDRNNLIRFGWGGIDDAEDADVIWHEYAHVLLDFTAPGLVGGHAEGNALHEGWSDYWAASYSRFLSEDDPQVPEHNWRRIYTWDGNMLCWPGRTLDHDGHYPDDLSYDPPGCQTILQPYQWGLLWATTLMDIYPQTGREVLDRLNLASHAYLGTGSGFVDAAEALIQADYDLYGGLYSSILVQELGEAGYIDPSEFGPILDHDPLKATEQTGGTIRVEVTASASTSPIDSVYVVFAVGDGAYDRFPLERATGNRYAGDFPLPDEAATVHYYVEAVDEEGRSRRLPATAPRDTYAFDVGPDEVPPVVRHDPPGHATLIAWPITLYAEVEDNLRVDSVWVDFEIRSSAGSVRSTGTFALEPNADVYAGRFPDPSTPVEAGDIVTYQIVARDAATAENETSAGAFEIAIVMGGELRIFDFEGLSQGVTATGTWSVDQPSFGLRVAHSGQRVWATTPDGAYPDTTSRSILTLPPLDLEGVGQAYLVFWHWYDFEHNGLARPGEFNDLAGIWDGGNVQVSLDKGETWSLLEPRSGYSGTIGADYGNPLAGQRGFGGYSYGWRREIVELPEGADVRIRFDFGTDDSNGEDALFYAGWYVDDILITTELPSDAAAPTAAGLPPERVVRLPGQEEPPSVSITTFDDTGIEAAISRYEIVDDEGTRSGTLRLAMSGTDLNVYQGFVVPAQAFSAGDRIEYTILLRDFDGNETVYGDPFVIDFRAEHFTTILESAVSTGAWRRLSGQWIASGSTEGPRSSLILEPFSVSTNAETNELILEHAYQLEDGTGGNVKISTDDGSTWSVLSPQDGYPSTFESAGHPMTGEAVFAGASDGLTGAVFDLDDYAGRAVRIRVDLAAIRALEADETWIVSELSYRSTTAEDEFTTERELALHANFPDPVQELTAISYTIAGDETIPVRLSVFDMLGRRVSVIRHAQHDPGSYTLQFDVQDLANGVYFLYLETPNGTRAERMVVLR